MDSISSNVQSCLTPASTLMIINTMIVKSPELPAVADRGTQKFVGFLNIRNAHCGAVPLQLALHTERQCAQQHPLRERSGDSEIRNSLLALLGGSDPVLVMNGNGFPAGDSEPEGLQLFGRQESRPFSIRARADIPALTHEKAAAIAHMLCRRCPEIRRTGYPVAPENFHGSQGGTARGRAAG